MELMGNQDKHYAQTLPKDDKVVYVVLIAFLHINRIRCVNTAKRTLALG
jgi:hypothetical protein